MVKVEIQSADVAVMEGTFDDGRKWKSRRQSAYVHFKDKPYPVEIIIKLPGDTAPYPPGHYMLSPDSLNVFKNQLELRRVILRPLPAAQSSQAA